MNGLLLTTPRVIMHVSYSISNVFFDIICILLIQNQFGYFCSIHTLYTQKFKMLAPFFPRCKIGQLNGNEVEEYARRKPGVYFRLERDLYSRVDQMGVEMRERAKWDIRESMVGTETFEPKHIIIATWKNVSFAGGITSANRIVMILKLLLFYILL